MNNQRGSNLSKTGQTKRRSLDITNTAFFVRKNELLRPLDSHSDSENEGSMAEEFNNSLIIADENIPEEEYNFSNIIHNNPVFVSSSHPSTQDKYLKNIKRKLSKSAHSESEDVNADALSLIEEDKDENSASEDKESLFETYLGHKNIQILNNNKYNLILSHPPENSGNQNLQFINRTSTIHNPKITTPQGKADRNTKGIPKKQIKQMELGIYIKIYILRVSIFSVRIYALLLRIHSFILFIKYHYMMTVYIFLTSVYIQG